jgi:hypothetical protein
MRVHLHSCLHSCRPSPGLLSKPLRARAIRRCNSHYIPPYSDDLVESDQIIRLGRRIFPYSSTPAEFIVMFRPSSFKWVSRVSLPFYMDIWKIIISICATCYHRIRFKIYIISSPFLPSLLFSHTCLFSRRKISSSSTRVYTRPLCFLTFYAP